MADPDNLYPDTLQFLRSPVFVSTVAAAISQLIALFGLQVPQSIISADVAAVAQVIAIIATLYAAYKRWRSKVQPLSLTKKDST